MVCRRTMPFISTWGVLALCLLAVSAGCGESDKSEPAVMPETGAAKPAPTAPETGPGPRDSGSTSGSMPTPVEELRRDIGLPDFYPDDAPTYPGARTSLARMSPNGEVNVMFGTDDSVDRVLDHMEEELEDAGWEVGARAPAPDGEVVDATKSGRRASVMVRRIRSGEDDEATMIAVAIDR